MSSENPSKSDKPGEEYEHSVAPDLRRLRARAMQDWSEESLLFLPAIMLASTIAIALLLAELDSRLSRDLRLSFAFPPGVASTLLSTIAGATITTAGVVFSLLVVSLQLASGQFSPRVLRSYWRDRFSKVLVGLLLSTFAFCVIALARIDPDAEQAPTLTMLAALVLTLASVVAIVVYLDRVSRQQYVGRILQRVVAETLTLIKDLPHGKRIGARLGEPVPPPDPAGLGPALVVRAPADGWVQQVSYHAIVNAVPPGSVVRLDTRVGAYLVRNEPLATIWPVPPVADHAVIGRLIGEAVVIGPARSMQQDIDFGLRQLNDIGLKALSPAVNDATTAIEVIVRLGSVMRPLLLADLPPQSVRDPHDRILLTPWELNHREYVRHAFDQLRVYTAEHPQIQVALVRTLRMLKDACAGVPGREPARVELDHQLALVLEACGKAGHTAADQARVEAAARG
ncbi:MAG TPA: DUF2254 domain-containing protein [Natronosporangium sp.]